MLFLSWYLSKCNWSDYVQFLHRISLLGISKGLGTFRKFEPCIIKFFSTLNSTSSCPLECLPSVPNFLLISCISFWLFVKHVGFADLISYQIGLQICQMTFSYSPLLHSHEMDHYSQNSILHIHSIWGITDLLIDSFRITAASFLWDGSWFPEK